MAAVAIAAIAAWGGGPSASSGPPSNRSAAGYLRDHRADLSAPGIAVAIVGRSAPTLAANGDVLVDSPFILGSATKSFTALAVMQLVEAGRVRLDDPAVRYIPDLATANRSLSERITVRQLLSHTSGLSTASGVDPLAAAQTTLHRQVLALRGTTAAQPGKFAYSNANYEVLGDLIEHVTGTSYAQYLRAHVLAPLGMTHTYTDLAAARAHGLRQGHRIWFGVPIGDGDWYRADFLPAGFLVSTVGDLSHYLTALLDGGRYQGRSILSPAGVSTLTTGRTSAALWGVNGGYGFGWYQRPTAGRGLVIDPGITRNMHTDLVLMPERHLGVAVLSDAESTLYEGSIPRFDILAMNVASIAADGAPGSGLLEGFYLIFDLIALTVILLYSVLLVGVLRSRRAGLAGRPWYRQLLILWRELLVPLVILIGLPAYFGEPWRTLLQADVGIVAALVALLGLVTAAARAAYALRSRRATDRAPSASAEAPQVVPAPAEAGR